MKKLTRRLFKIFDKATPLAKRVISALFYGISGNIISRAIQLLCGILIARIISKIQYGQYSIVYSTVSLFVLIAGAGVEATLTRYVSRYRDNPLTISKIVTTISVSNILFGFFVGVFLFVFSNKISIWISNTIELTMYLKLSAIAVLFAILSSAFRSVLIGYEKYRNTAVIEVVSSLIYFIITIVAVLSYGIRGAVVGLLMLHLFRSFFYGVLCIRTLHKKGVSFIFQFDNDIRKIFTSFTIPAYIASLSVVPVNWLLNVIIAKNLGLAELAVYSVAMQWQTMIIYIPTQMNQLRPIYTDLHAKGQFIELKKLLIRTSLYSVSITLPLVIIVSIFGKWILGFYGSDYILGYVSFLIIILTMIPYAMQMQIGSFLQSIGKMWHGLLLNSIWALTSIIGGYLAIKWGLIGFAVSYFVSYTIHCVLSWITLYFLGKASRAL